MIVEGRTMRRVLLGLVGIVFATDAFAADYFRGSYSEAPPARYYWGGVYFGGQIGYTETIARFDAFPRTAVVDPLLRPTIESAANLANWPGLPTSDSRGTSYGGFFGYNAQWGEVVLGVELNYSHAATDISNSQTAVVAVGTGIGQVDYFANMHLTDFASARLRA